MVSQTTKLKRLSVLLGAALTIAFSPLVAAFEAPPPLGVYQKVSTRFDGVTLEDTVTYLAMTPTDQAQLTLSTMSKGVQSSDFTFKFWFKAEDLQPDDSVQFFSFPESVSCYMIDVNEVLTVMCDTPQRQRVIAKCPSFVSGKWYYFSLSVTSSGDAQLSLWDRNGLVATDQAEGFFLVQTVSRGWYVCFGLCDQDSNGIETGFTGGIREVLAISAWQSQKEIQENSNRIQIFVGSHIEGYYRFAAQDPRKFMLEEFKEWRVRMLSAVPENDMGRDMIPNDMCPLSFETDSFVRFFANQEVPLTQIAKTLEQQRYAYTMSLTVWVDSDSCTTTDFQYAEESCNIVLIKDTFMLFFSGPYVGRFHFYAEKNYFESQSSGFFVPFNQWVTIQMQVTHYDGYQIVVLDQQGTVLTNFHRSQNMQEQLPVPEIALFSGLSGFASRFVFVDKAYYLPKPYSHFENVALVDVSFTNLKTLSVHNAGSSRDLALALRPLNQVVPIKITDYGETAPAYPAFDGIACNDSHRTMKLNSEVSSLMFETPPMSDWMSETSLSFWFKIEDWSIVGEGKVSLTQSIFTMQSQNQFESYWFVFLRGGELAVAPFGLNKLSEPTLLFGEFNEKKADESGWWHMTCYYQFYAKIECTLHNENLDVTRVQSLLGLSEYFFPKYSLTAVLGKTQNQIFPAAKGLLVKEVQYWSRKVMLPEARITRYQQLDPRTAVGLLAYFRLSLGVPTVTNFAEMNPDYSFNGTNVRYSGVNWQPDLLVKSQTVYDEETLSLVEVATYHYHNVCPLYTYRKGKSCFAEPVNQGRLAVFPKWNTVAEKLDWIITLEQSSFITKNVLEQLVVDWSAKDESMQILLDRVVIGAPDYIKTISSDEVRHENLYHVSANLKNEQNMFDVYTHVHFMPNNCHWFEVGIDDAFSGYREINLLPGAQDIFLQLKLRQNPSIECKDFNFYNKFKSVDFKFIVDSSDETYIIEQPQVNVKLVSPKAVSLMDGREETLEDQEAARTADDLVVYVSVPIAEQHKIPVWSDVKILMTIEWTSSEFDLKVSGNVFQNALYTIKFAPVSTYLVSKIIPNYKYVQKGQTLIISSNETTVSGLHPSQVQDMLSYKWICPEYLEILCEGQTGPNLYVPWNRVQLAPLNFSQVYDFTAEITWSKPDGTNETRLTSTSVQWYNLQKPIFEIGLTLDQVLVSSTQPTTFTIEGKNFDSYGDMSIYVIQWTIKPRLQNQYASSTFNYGQKLVVDAGNWKENTKYTISASLTFQEEPSINGTSQLQFETFAPPKNGTVTISPPHGYLGEFFTIQVEDYEDPVGQVFYNVFNSYDSTGSLKGTQLNNRTMPMKIDYKYLAQTSNPIIVEVINLKGEKVVQVLKPWIVQRPDPICTKELIFCPQQKKDNTTSNTPVNQSASNETEANGARRLRNKRQRDPIVEQNTTSNKTNSTVDASVEEQSFTNRTIGEDGCTYKFTCIIQEYEFIYPDPVPEPEQVDPVNITCTNHTGNLTEHEDSVCNYNEESNQTVCCRAINSTNSTSNETSSNSETPVDEGRLLQETQPSQDSTSYCSQIDAELRTSNKINKFDEAFKAFDTTNEICILDALVQQARLDYNSKVIEQVIQKLLTHFTNGQVYESSEIQVSSQVFNHESALSKAVYWLPLLESSFELDAEALLWQFPDQPMQNFYMQGVAVRGIEEATQVYLRVIDSANGKAYEMKELDGQVSLTFKITPARYVSGQTVCQGLLGSGQWTSDVCLTELNPQELEAKCSCGLTRGVTQISFRQDISQAEGEPISFPAPLVDPEIQGTSFFFMALVSLISFTGLLGSLIAWRLDRKDWDQIRNLTQWKLNLVKGVAAKLNQPLEQVKLRQEDLVNCHVQAQTNTLAAVVNKVHPVFAPYTSFHPTQTRLSRFTAYHLQVNLFVIASMVYFGPTYRQGDILRQDTFLDQTDVNEIYKASALGAIALLPILSQPICWLLSNLLKVNDSQVEVVRRRFVLRALFTAACLAINFCTVLMAVWVCQNAPTSNQYVLGCGIFGGFFSATFGTNMLRASFNTLSVPYLTCAHARQLLKDYEAVSELKMGQVKIADETFVSVEAPFDAAAALEQSDMHCLKTHVAPRGGSVLCVETPAFSQLKRKSIL